MNPEIKTKRLLLRRFKTSDREAYAKLLMDEEVNLHIPGGATKTLSDAHYWFDKIFETYKDQENKKHNEIWAAVFEENLIGFAEVKSSTFTTNNELEVSGFLMKEYWRRGFAKEVYPALSTHVKSLGKVMIATVNPENLASVELIKYLDGIKAENTVQFEDYTFLKFYFP